jgi:hypothetical protein
MQSRGWSLSVGAGLPKEIYVLLVSSLVSGNYFPTLYASILKRIRKKEEEKNEPRDV